MMAFAAPADDDEDRVGGLFEARFDGRCAWCSERIHEGEMIYMSPAAGGAAHEEHREEEIEEE